MRWVQECEKEGREICVHHLLEEPKTQAEVKFVSVLLVVRHTDSRADKDDLRRCTMRKSCIEDYLRGIATGVWWLIPAYRGV